MACTVVVARHGVPVKDVDKLPSTNNSNELDHAVQSSSLTIITTHVNIRDYTSSQGRQDKKLVGSSGSSASHCLTKPPSTAISSAHSRLQGNHKPSPVPVSKDSSFPHTAQIPHTRTAHDWGCTRPLASAIAPPGASPYILPPGCAEDSARDTGDSVPAIARWIGTYWLLLVLHFCACSWPRLNASAVL